MASNTPPSPKNFFMALFQSPATNEISKVSIAGQVSPAAGGGGDGYGSKNGAGDAKLTDGRPQPSTAWP